ncbi:MAG: hypothetical protein KF690_02675 [Bacteroidetes bacterium]|nr:hypothetical protein [Bacteroidota bacterium]
MLRSCPHLKTLLLVCLLACAHTTLFGQARKFKLEKGSTPEGGTYTGTLTTKSSPDDENVLYVQWQTTAGDYHGIGLGLGELGFSTTYGEGYFGLAMYSLEPNQSNGVWTDSQEGTIATETIAGTPYKINADHSYSLVPGTYPVHGNNADGSQYKGTLTLKSHGEDGIQAIWSTGGSSQAGSGFMAGGMLVLCFGSGAQGTAFYTDLTGKGSLLGVWLVNGGTTLGTERLSLVE